MVLEHNNIVTCLEADGILSMYSLFVISVEAGGIGSLLSEVPAAVGLSLGTYVHFEKCSRFLFCF